MKLSYIPQVPTGAETTAIYYGFSKRLSGEIKALQDRLGEHNQQIRTSQNTHARISERMLATLSTQNIGLKTF